MKVKDLRNMLDTWILDGYGDTEITVDRGSIRFQIQYTHLVDETNRTGDMDGYKVVIEVANPRSKRLDDRNELIG